jgi:hypothetical protein
MMHFAQEQGATSPRILRDIVKGIDFIFNNEREHRGW